MKNVYRFTLAAGFVLALAFTFGCSSDDNENGNNETDSTITVLGIKLTSIKDADKSFSISKSQPLMIYYFGHSCPQCKNHYAEVQQIAKEYEQKGLASIAVSVSNATKKDILTFMEQQKATIPFFQDDEGAFGEKYGDGFIPRLYLISKDENVTRYADFKSEGLENIKADIEKLIGEET